MSETEESLSEALREPVFLDERVEHEPAGSLREEPLLGAGDSRGLRPPDPLSSHGRLALSRMEAQEALLLGTTGRWIRR